MNHQLRNLRKEAYQIRLSQAERSRMRQHIFGEAFAVANPYLVSYNWFSLRLALPMAAVLVVVLGTGTVYAAGGALPGDTLYTVKVDIAEPLRGTFAFSRTAQAEFHASVAKTRMEEAEKLASQGRLTASTTVSLEENLNEHVAAAQAITKTLAEDDPDTATEVTTALDSSLSAHGAILAWLGKDSADSDTREHSARMALAIGESRAQYKKSSSMLDAPQTLSVAETSADDSIDRAASKSQKKSESQLADVQKQFKESKTSFGTSTAERVEGRFKEIRQQIDAGDTVGALRAGVELSEFIEAGDKFDGNILEHLIREKVNKQDKEGDKSNDGSDD
ncbi:hypothetical protein HYS79_01965 [Patescibacteria group bacterium]|nr:hypothetical protein [Patescibacteria group bacterium]